MNFLYHIACCQVWITLGQILIWIEPGTKGSRHCINKAKYHYSQMTKK